MAYTIWLISARKANEQERKQYPWDLIVSYIVAQINPKSGSYPLLISCVVFDKMRFLLLRDSPDGVNFHNQRKPYPIRWISLY